MRTSRRFISSAGIEGVALGAEVSQVVAPGRTCPGSATDCLGWAGRLAGPRLALLIGGLAGGCEVGGWLAGELAGELAGGRAGPGCLAGGLAGWAGLAG